MIWNEEKCEIEYKEKDDEGQAESPSLSQSPSSNNLKKSESETPTTSNARPMYRFGQNDNAPGSCMAYLSSGSTRPGIKRSASQVPSTERRPVTSTLTINATSPSSKETEQPIKDYQVFKLMHLPFKTLNVKYKPLPFFY